MSIPFQAGQFVWSRFPFHERPNDPGPIDPVAYIARVVTIHGRPHATAVSIYTTTRQVRAGEAVPPGQLCGGILKSATIFFGEALVAADLNRAFAAAAQADLLLSVGTTLQVYPVADMVPIAASNGASIVIVNGEPTPMDDLADVVVLGSISEVLPAIIDT